MPNLPRLANRTFLSAEQIRTERQHALAAGDTELAEQLAAALEDYQSSLRAAAPGPSLTEDESLAAEVANDERQSRLEEDRYADARGWAPWEQDT